MLNDSVYKIAQYFIFTTNSAISPTKLQKGLYYLNIIYKLECKEALFPFDLFTAWTYGPIYFELWSKWKLNKYEIEGNNKIYDIKNNEIVKKIIDEIIIPTIKNMTGNELSILTHNELSNLYNNSNNVLLEPKKIQESEIEIFLKDKVLMSKNSFIQRYNNGNWR